MIDVVSNQRRRLPGLGFRNQSLPFLALRFASCRFLPTTTLFSLAPFLGYLPLSLPVIVFPLVLTSANDAAVDAAENRVEVRLQRAVLYIRYLLLRIALSDVKAKDAGWCLELDVLGLFTPGVHFSTPVLEKLFAYPDFNPPPS